jgi:hypothetical protein
MVHQRADECGFGCIPAEGCSHRARYGRGRTNACSLTMKLSCFEAPVAQGIERLPPEQEAAGSNPAGRADPDGGRAGAKRSTSRSPPRLTTGISSTGAFRADGSPARTQRRPSKASSTRRRLESSGFCLSAQRCGRRSPAPPSCRPRRQRSSAGGPHAVSAPTACSAAR